MAIFDPPSSAVCCLPVGTLASATGNGGTKFQKVQKFHFHPLGAS